MHNCLTVKMSETLCNRSNSDYVDVSKFYGLKPEDSDTICRTCLTRKPKNLISLLGSKMSSCSSDFKLFLDFFVNLKVSGYPTSVCEECYKKLSDAFALKIQCESSNVILKQLLGLHFKHSEGKINNTLLEASKAELFDEKYEPKNILDKKERLDSKKGRRRKNNSTPVSTNDDLDVICNNGNIKETVSVVENSEALEQPFGRLGITNDVSDLSASPVESKELACSKCHKCYSDIKSFKRHKLKHKNWNNQDISSTESSDLTCSVCNKCYPDIKSLKKHKSKHKSTSKRYKCSHCDKSFSDKKPLEFHSKLHTGERPYICDTCGKSYIQPHNLVVHRRQHTGEAPYRCPDSQCGKAFTNGASLSLHMPVHTGVKNYVCPVCGKRVARSGEMTVHLRTHSGERPYVCDICSKGFIKKSSLQAHTYSHTGEKKYMCPICGHRVAHAGKLTVHIKTHSDIKPYSCEQCNRNFASKIYLKKHSKTHADKIVENLTCPHCGKFFTNNKNYAGHITVCHQVSKNETFMCTVCSQQFTTESVLNIHLKSVHPDSTSSLPSPLNADDLESVAEYNNGKAVIGKVTNNKIVMTSSSDERKNVVGILENTIHASLSKISLNPQNASIMSDCHQIKRSDIHQRSGINTTLYGYIPHQLQ